MNAQKLESVLRCPKCQSADFRKSADALLCVKCQSSYRVKGEKIFFDEPPLDARELVERRPNPKKQSVARKFVLSYFKKHLESQPKDIILCDVGTGTSPFADITDQFENFVGVDFFAYARVPVVTDITKPLPLRDAFCDAVLCSEVLEHVPNPTVVVNEMRRILKPGGFLIGSVPFLHPVHYAPYDYHRYTRFALERLFREAGFLRVEIVEIGTPFDYYKSVQNRFFSAYALSTTFFKNPLANSLFKFWLKCIRKIQSLFLSTVSGPLSRMPISPEVPMAYCFRAFTL